MLEVDEDIVGGAGEMMGEKLKGRVSIGAVRLGTLSGE